MKVDIRYIATTFVDKKDKKMQMALGRSPRVPRVEKLKTIRGVVMEKKLCFFSDVLKS